MIKQLRKLRVTFFSICFVALSLAVSVSPALANDRKIYPATSCEIFGPDMRADMHRYIGFSQFGRVENQHPSRALGLVCPIIRDNTGNTNGIDYVRVTVLNRHPTQQLTCTLYSVNLNGENAVDSAQISVNFSNSFQTMNFDGGNALDQSLSAGSYYTLFCSIPPAVGTTYSWIGGYVVDEFN